MDSPVITKQLNTAQQQVVNHQDGPLLVVAGAGTGKTGVLVERINKLLDAGIESHRILAVTFTEKAAAEMLERVLERLSGFELELPILTFNALGQSLLQEFNTEIGLSRNFLLIGDNAKIVFLRQHLTELELEYFSPVSNPEGLLPDLADYFSKLKQHVISPEIYLRFVQTMPSADDAEQLEKVRHQELVRAYSHYIRLCKEYNLIDYDDQIYRVIELLQTRPHVKKTLQDRYHTVMIDEFQDTNPMQSKLIDLLVNQTGNLVVVGDDDQSIYGFRGATLANILLFKERYAAAKEVTLTENYRSTQELLDSSYQLIQHNNPYRLETSLGINKKLHAQTNGEPVQLSTFTHINQELYWLGQQIEKRIKEGETPGGIAVLCRRNTSVQQVSTALTLAGIDHVVIGERYQLYQTPIVRLLVEVLRAVVDTKADTSLYHTLTGALFTIEPAQLADIASTARREHQNLFDAITGQEKDSFQALKAASKLIADWRQQAATLSVGRLVYKIIEESGYKQRLTQAAMKDSEEGTAILQLAEFFHTLREFESIAVQPTAIQYMESYAVLEAAGDSGEDGTLHVSSEKVNVLTIHKAKGLEWPTVFIPDCTEGSFPLRARGGGITLPESLISETASAADDHLAEERRLMYVAMTRAKQNLSLSYATKHAGPAPRKPSRFITEIFGEQSTSILPTNTEDIPDKNLDHFRRTTAITTPVSVPNSIFDGSIIRLSVSQITTFIHCPLDFYFRFVLTVPEAPSSAASYGTVIHELIETMNKSLLEANDLSFSDVESQFEALWKPVGYVSKDHQDRAKKQGLTTLQNFYENHLSQTVQVPYLVEWPFALKLEPERMVIKGRLDAVYETEKGIEIRDYKTSSSVTTPEKAKSRASASDQLTLYALVWQELKGELPHKLSLEFVDTGMIGEIRKTQRGIDTMRAKIGEMAEAIKKNEFRPGKDHRYCHHPELPN